MSLASTSVLASTDLDRTVLDPTTMDPTALAEVPSVRRPSAMRTLGVTIGPSLVLNALAAACTAWAARELRSRGSHSQFARGVRGAAVLGALAPWIYRLTVRPWVLRWGATTDEVRQVLPGDDVVPQPVWQSTRAITIAAPPEAIWPWLAQMGQDRGGLYSYDWLENLAGLEFHSADRIHPEWQDVKVGDIVRFAPGEDTLTVRLVQPNRALVWQVRDPTNRWQQEPESEVAAPPARGPNELAVDATWAFVLQPVDGCRTRLVQRFRFCGRPRWALSLAYSTLMEIPHFVMERAMLLGIKERAERSRLGRKNGRPDHCRS